MRQHFRSIHKGTLPGVLYLPRRRCLHTASKRSTREQQTEASKNAEAETLQEIAWARAQQFTSRKNDIRSYLRRWAPPVDDNLNDALNNNAASSRSPQVHHSRSKLDNGLDVESAPEASIAAAIDELKDREQGELAGGEADLSAFVHYVFSLEPGDLICLRDELAVFVRREAHHHIFLVPDGRCVVPKTRYHSSYTIKSFASPDNVAALSAALIHDPTLVTYLPASNIDVKAPPVAVTGPILSKMQELQREMDTFNRANPTVMDDIYQSAASKAAFRQLAFQDFAQTCLPKQQPLSEAAKLALHTNFANDVRFVMYTSLYQTSIALIPSDLWNACDRVMQWARAYQDAAAQAASGGDVADQLRSNPLTSFIDKARALILQSRRYRSPSSISTLGPSNFTLPTDGDSSADRIINDEFSADDKDVISFLWVLYCMTPKFAGNLIGHYLSIGALVLRALGAYPKAQLDYRTGRLALQEMGCIAPWHDFGMFHVFAPLATLGFDPVANKLSSDIQAFSKLTKSASGAGLSHDDPLQHIRKDWGNLPVYAIDNANVVSKDDGISLESSTSNPGSYWIHLHIADIASHFRKDHPFIKKALWMGTPYYGKLFTEHMMDWKLTGFVGIGVGSSVLTISTLIDPDGNVQDIQIIPGKVNNIIDVDRSILSQQLKQFEIGDRVVLDLTKQKEHSRLGLEEEDPAIRNRKEEVVLEHMPVFIKLSEILDKRAAARDADLPSSSQLRKELFYGSSAMVGEVKVPSHYTNIYRSVHYRRDPGVYVSALKTPVADPLHVGGSFARGLVGDCAMLAEESTGRWLFDRHIPAIYTGHKFLPGKPAEKWIEEERERRQHPDIEPIESNLQLPIHALSTEPSVNLSLSTRYYCNITSPLRSSTDLAMHYQINAYFRTENDFSLGKDRDSIVLRRLAYSEEDLKKLLSRISSPTLPEQLSTQATSHWFYQAFHRAFHFKEAELPALWNVRVMRGLSGDTKGKLHPFGLKVMFVESKEKFETTAEAGTFLPCEIQEVDPVRKLVLVLAKGPATQNAEVGIDLLTTKNVETLGVLPIRR